MLPWPRTASRPEKNWQYQTVSVKSEIRQIEGLLYTAHIEHRGPVFSTTVSNSESPWFKSPTGYSDWWFS
jgi:hypothetical protein